MMNRGLKAFFWLMSILLSVYFSFKFNYYYNCEEIRLIEGMLLIFAVMVPFVYSVYKFLSNTFVNTIKDHRILLTAFFSIVYFYFNMQLSENNRLNNLKENGGVVISAIILSKHPHKKSDSQFNVEYKYDGNQYRRRVAVNNQDYKSKHIGDTVLLLFSPTCKSTSIGYDLYPSKADVEKCWKGCDYVYGQK
jgi:hypothetical protein